MNILLSNDDGIQAVGIQTLADALAPMADLEIVAPDTEQSAVGHAITIHQPLKVKEYCRNGKMFGYAVTGTPADCVKLALTTLFSEYPDLLISGINQGPNVGTDIIYSGTVSAATEGTFLGIPSLAVSLNSFDRDAHFETAARAVKALIPMLPELDVPKDVLLNVNVPNVPWEDVKGWRMTQQCETKYVESFVERRDPRGNVYYWIDGTVCESPENSQSDYFAVKENWISVTPLRFDVTHHEFIARAHAAFEERMNRADGG